MLFISVTKFLDTDLDLTLEARSHLPYPIVSPGSKLPTLLGEEEEGENTALVLDVNFSIFI